MTHEATFSGSSSSATEPAASSEGLTSPPSPHASSSSHAACANDAFLLTLRPLLNLYESPTSPAWGCRK